MERTTVSPSTVDRVRRAGLLAPLIELPLFTAWMVAAELITPTVPPLNASEPEVVRVLFGGLFYGILFVVPFAYAATLLVGVPVVLLWLRRFGRIDFVTTVLVGTVLSLGVALALALLLARGNYHLGDVTGLTFWGVSGMLIAATGWWLAFGRRQETRPA